MKKSLLALCLMFLASVVLLGACGGEEGNGQPRPLAKVPPEGRYNYYKSEPPMSIDTSRSYEAIIHTTQGDITVQLRAAAAPHGVNNFVFLAKQGFYDGLFFHRVEPGFVVQGGDPLGDGSGGPGYTLPAEIGLKHEKGAVAWARLPDQVNPDRRSSGSQFYITLAPTHFLDEGYSVFGYVTKGMDVVEKIKRGDKIKSIEIVEK